MSTSNSKPQWYDSKLLKKNPANRANIRRLNECNKEALFELITTSEGVRKPTQLVNAGIVRPDWSEYNFLCFWNKMEKGIQEYFLSDKFIRKWLAKGYIASSDYTFKKCKDCVSVYSRYDDNDRPFLNMTCAVVDESECVLQNCYLPFAKLDNMHFYNAIIDNCVLDGATAYNTLFSNCNGGGARDDLQFLKYLQKLGVEGIDVQL